MNFLAHRQQWYGLSLVWIFMWRLVWSVAFKFEIHINLWYIFHVAFPVTFFTLFLVIQVFFYKPDYNNQNGNLLQPHMLLQPLFRRVCSVALIIIKLQTLHSQSENLNFHDCILKFLSIFSIFSRFSFLLLSQLLFHWNSLVLMTSVNWFIGAVPRYWGCLTSIALKHLPHMSHLKVTLGPG